MEPLTAPNQELLWVPDRSWSTVHRSHLLRDPSEAARRVCRRRARVLKLRPEARAAAARPVELMGSRGEPGLTTDRSAVTLGDPRGVCLDLPGGVELFKGGVCLRKWSLVGILSVAGSQRRLP